MPLDVWPALPLVVLGAVSEDSVDDVIAQLGHSNRITQIQIDLNRYILRVEALWTAMQVPFPELSVVHLQFGDMAFGPVLPDSFLGGSAPRLRYLTLGSISFPGLPNLLLSATQLVYLSLLRVPHSGYVSPEAMANCLSVLTNLETFQLEFVYPRSPTDQESRRPRPPTRHVLPALTNFWFQGLNKYLEDLVSRIDAPRLYQLSTTFFSDIDFDTSELSQFIGRTPKFGSYNEARLIFRNHEARLKLQSHPEPSDQETVDVKVFCQEPVRQVSSLAQICSSSLHLLPMVENLYIYEDAYSPPAWKKGDLENAQWLDLLLPFTAVKNLYLSKKAARRIAPALQELTGRRATEVLQALQNILIEWFWPSEEPAQEGIAQFISARQLTNYPVTISSWEKLRIGVGRVVGS